jgi:hypothetical protein
MHSATHRIGHHRVFAGLRQHSLLRFVGFTHRVSLPNQLNPAPALKKPARALGQLRFLGWYNTAHRHSGIGYLTPETVHFGRATQMQQRRAAALDIAFRCNPNRFKGVAPLPPSLPTAVWINPPKKETASTTTADACTVISCHSVSQSH